MAKFVLKKPKKPADDAVTGEVVVSPENPGPKAKYHLPVVASDTNIPPMECSACHISEQCSEYAPGYVCAFEKKFSSFGTRDATEILDTMYEITGQAMRRYRMALLAEQTVSGGATNPEVTRLEGHVFDLLKQLADFKRGQQSMTVKVEGQRGMGVLARLFGADAPAKVGTELELNPPNEANVQQAAAPESVTIEMTNKPPLG